MGKLGASEVSDFPGVAQKNGLSISEKSREKGDKEKGPIRTNPKGLGKLGDLSRVLCSIYVSQLNHLGFVARDRQMFLGGNRNISCLCDSGDMLLAYHSHV